MITVEYQDYEQQAKNESYYITNLVANIRISSYAKGKASRAELTVLTNEIVRYNNGGRITIITDEVNVFMGYIFSIKDSEKNEIKIVAYDQLRYLKNKDVYITKNDTVTSVFTNICNGFKLKYNVLDNPPTQLPVKIHDNVGLYDILDWAIGYAEIMEHKSETDNKRYLIWDNFGVLELFEAERAVTNYVFGDDNLVFGYDLEKSIDTQTYNLVKYSQENKISKIRQNRIVYNSETVKRWGVLQYFKTISSDATESQIIKEMVGRLNDLNHETRKLRFNAIGNWELRAGKGIWITLTNNLEERIVQRGMITECVQQLEGGTHTMTLTVEIPKTQLYEINDEKNLVRE